MSLSTPLRIALLGEYNPESETHIATDAAIQHSASALGLPVAGEWISSRVAYPELLSGFDGVWVTPGPPHPTMERTLECIRYARAQRIPTFANCGGFQLVVLEIARNIFCIQDAQHDEYSSTAAVRVIVPLSCSLRGQELPIEIVKESLAGALYQRTQVVERYYCAYGINPDYRSHFTSDLLTVAGFDSAGEMRVLEIKDHPFFLATLYVPQALSSGSCPHPLVTGFLKSALQNR